jgi:hypothetical protein
VAVGAAEHRDVLRRVGVEVAEGFRQRIAP